MISIVAAVAGSSDAMKEFCFDCPAESAFSADVLVLWIVVSMIARLPGFFMGMLIHRRLGRMPLVVRSLIVGGTVPVFWFLLAGALGGGAGLNEFPIAPFLPAALIAAVASSFDGSRVDAERSSTNFSGF